MRLDEFTPAERFALRREYRHLRADMPRHAARRTIIGLVRIDGWYTPILS